MNECDFCGTIGNVEGIGYEEADVMSRCIPGHGCMKDAKPVDHNKVERDLYEDYLDSIQDCNEDIDS